MTPLEIIRTEMEFPGLIDDLARIQWLVNRAKPRKMEVDGKSYEELL